MQTIAQIEQESDDCGIDFDLVIVSLRIEFGDVAVIAHFEFGDDFVFDTEANKQLARAIIQQQSV